jgi:Tfp pilus assembly protein PilV
MFEALVAMLLLSILGLGMAKSMILAIHTIRRSDRNAVALQLAQRKMEEFAMVNPSSLTNANDQTESNLQVRNMAFTRSSDVTVNSDASVTVLVTVSPSVAGRGKTVALTSTFPVWGLN